MSEENTIEQEVPVAKEMTPQQEYFAKRCKVYREYKKKKVVDTKQIVEASLHQFMLSVRDAYNDGFEYDEFEPKYAAFKPVGSRFYVTLVKYAPPEPTVPKEIPPELAEIQAKFPEQEGAAAKEFAEPPKRGRKPVAKGVT